MDNNEEYHDPDYPEVPVFVKEEPPTQPEEDTIEKIKEIITREFTNEIDVRENEVMLLDQRITTSRRILHRLRYAIVNSYYNELKLELSNSQIQDEIAAQRDPRSKAEISSLLREGQREIHPSVRKLLGKKTVDLSEIFKTRAPRNKVRKDYHAMLQKRNYTISADASTKSLRPSSQQVEVKVEPCTSQVTKVPRHLEPKITNVMTLDESTRNQMKHKYRIVIGNTSKYAPGASPADRSTHKWLLYIRGPPAAPDLSRLVRAVSVRLHHSYAPHHTVVLHKPPFHITRRGWGEFPAKIELEFALPHRNRPAIVTHTIRLDNGCTGVQTLGAETLVDVWLYSTPEMLQYEFKEEQTPNIHPPNDPPVKVEPKIEPTDEEIKTDEQTDSWLDFFNKEPKELDVDEMFIKPEKKVQDDVDLDSVIDKNVIDKEISANQDLPQEILNQPAVNKKRIVKYIDPTTGKIYYLEMDKNLDLSKVQEIIINNTTAKISPVKSNGLKSVKKKQGVSLLKPEVKNLLKMEQFTAECKKNLVHIQNDHCYLANPIAVPIIDKVESDKKVGLYKHFCVVSRRFDTVRAGVSYMLKNMPVISDLAKDEDYLRHFPFTVDSCDRYWKMDFAKRRNIEWSRAKLINKILSENFTHNETIWRTKQILVYARLHGFYPVRNELVTPKLDDNWSTWQGFQPSGSLESNIKEFYPNAASINTLSVFQKEQYSDNISEVMDLVESDDEVDIVGLRSTSKGTRESTSEGSFKVLPVEDHEERLRFFYLEKKCADIGIELRCEDVGNGYFYSAAHAVLLCALRCFATELVRGALAQKLSMDSPSSTVWTGSSSSRPVIGLEHVMMASAESRLQMLTGKDTGVVRDHKQTHL